MLLLEFAGAAGAVERRNGHRQDGIYAASHWCAGDQRLHVDSEECAPSATGAVIPELAYQYGWYGAGRQVAVGAGGRSNELAGEPGSVVGDLRRCAVRG